MMESVAQKHAGLVQRLAIWTDAKRAKWALNDDRDPELNVRDYSVTLSASYSMGTNKEIVTLKTHFGDFLEAFSDEDLADVQTGGFDGWFDIMVSLRLKAFRQAVGAEQALDAILNALDDEGK